MYRAIAHQVRIVPPLMCILHSLYYSDLRFGPNLHTKRLYPQKPIITFLPSSKSLQLHAPQVFAKAPHVKELPKPLRALNEPGDATFDPLTSNIAIRCANDSYVLLPSVKQQDRKLLAAKEWWNGVRPEWLNNGVLRLGHFYRSGDQPENPR